MNEHPIITIRIECSGITWTVHSDQIHEIVSESLQSRIRVAEEILNSIEEKDIANEDIPF